MKRARLRIVCRAPRPPTVQGAGGDLGVVINGRIADLSDAHVYVVHADGSEEELQGVTEVAWSVKPNEIAIATIKVFNADLDVDAIQEDAP